MATYEAVRAGLCSTISLPLKVDVVIYEIYKGNSRFVDNTPGSSLLPDGVRDVTKLEGASNSHLPLSPVDRVNPGKSDEEVGRDIDVVWLRFNSEPSDDFTGG